MSVEQNPAGHVISTAPWNSLGRGWHLGAGILSVTVTITQGNSCVVTSGVFLWRGQCFEVSDDCHRPEVYVQSLPRSRSTLCLETGSRLSSLACNLQTSSCLLLPGSRVTGACCQVSFLCRCWESKPEFVPRDWLLKSDGLRFRS